VAVAFWSGPAFGRARSGALTVSYLMEGITVNKVVSVVLDIPRLSALKIMPRGIPKSAQFEVQITLGG
jgi:hypothetical protein